MTSHHENVLIQVQYKLRQDKINLWLEPYYSEDNGIKESEIDNLANQLSQDLKIEKEELKNVLVELQARALKNLEARRTFQESGTASFTLKVVKAGSTPDNDIIVQCLLTELGQTLLDIIATTLQISDSDKIKVISAGKIIKPDQTLQKQGLEKYQQQLMVIVSSDDSNADASNEAMHQRIARIKKDIKKIVKSKNKNDLLQMEDQDGNAIYLPPEENDAIIMALAYCEKGRSAMKKERYDEAVILFLEADQLFSTCKAEILQSVDNYALLNLDIVWCYLCLKNVSLAPDAKRRLELCEKFFIKSYGPNLSRVMALKGNTSNERALFLRLHLLQGILLFHENRRREALDKICQSERELKNLKIDENQLSSLMEMGYEMVESRVGLRACNGDVTQAIQFIIDNRNKRADARKKAKKERASMRNAGGEATSPDEKWVNPRSVHTLVEMGFPEKMAKAALVKGDNSLSVALDFLHSNPEALIEEITQPQVPIDDSLIQELTKIGFSPELAKMALQNAYNNPEKAVDFLLKMQAEGNLEDLVRSLADVDDGAGPSTSAGATSIFDDVSIATKLCKDERESMKAYERFAEDVNNVDEDYLDLPLDQEETLILEYKNLLQK